MSKPPVQPGAFDQRFWNLTQAAAWVRFRSRELVDRFVVQDIDHYRSINFYSTMEKYPELGSISDLATALMDGRLKAWGRKPTDGTLVEEVPAIEWSDLHIRPRRVLRRHPSGGDFEPWIDLRFESGDLKRLWRSTSETSSRSKFNWQVIEEMWREVCGHFTDASENERIDELRLRFEAKFNREPPSRTAIQSRIKRWR